MTDPRDLLDEYWELARAEGREGRTPESDADAQRVRMQLELALAPIPDEHVKLFKTTVLGVGPYCIEFPDGEVIYTRTEARQLFIAAAFALSRIKPKEGFRFWR